MPFQYRQSTGEMTDGVFISVGYSGNGPGLNNPAMQQVRAVGPIPQGTYTIALPELDEQVGPVAMRLTPDPANTMYGRSAFLIHGDNQAMDYTASEGCIILPLTVRVKIGDAVARGDNQLQIVA